MIKSTLKVVDTGLNDILKSFEVAGGESISIGIGPEAKYPDGTPVAEVAMAHEYGTATIPQRAFMAMFYDSTAPMVQTISRRVATLDTPADVSRSMVQGAQELETEYKARFDSLNLAPLAPSTIEAKGSTQPLKDTGRLKESIKGKVERTADADR